MKTILSVVGSKEIISAIIGAFIPILIGGIWLLYNSLCPGLRLTTKRDFSIIRYLCYLVINWIISVFGALFFILMRQDGIGASTKYGVIVICGTCVFFAIIVYIICMPKKHKYSFLFGISPIISGIGMGYGSCINAAMISKVSGMMLVVTELIGMIYYDKTLVIHKHKYAHLKSIDGESVNCKCRDMKFHGFRQIIEIKQTEAEITTLIPYTQIVKIQYEGEVDEVENTDSIRYHIAECFLWIKKKVRDKKAK